MTARMIAPIFAIILPSIIRSLESDNSGSLETVFEERKRAEVAPRRGISVNTDDNHLQAAFPRVAPPLTQDADAFTDGDRSLWYDLIEELRARYVAARLRRAASKTGERSNSEGERSNIEGDRSNFEGDRSNSERDGGKHSRAVVTSAVLPAKS